MSNTDLLQYNGNTDFPSSSNVGTDNDPYLVPTDGPQITAISNLNDEAPVGTSLFRIKDILLGIRDGIFGDRTGAIMRSVRALQVDIAGGLASIASPGTIGVSGPPGKSGPAITAYTGDVICANGNLRASESAIIGNLVREFSYLIPGILFFNNNTTGGNGSNPPITQAIPNQLRALNTPKAWVTFSGDGKGGPGVVVLDGAGISSVTKDPKKFTITWVSKFDSNNYCISIIVSGSIAVNPPWQCIVINKTTTTCDIAPFQNGVYFDPLTLPTNFTVDVVAFGRQTT